MFRYFIAIAAVLCLLAPARSDVVVLRDGVDGYQGTADVYFSQGPNSHAGSYNLGGSATSGNFYANNESELGLVRFDLSHLSASSVYSATLMLYQKSNYTSRLIAQQVGMSWTQGTGTGYGSILDGATHRNRHAPTSVDNTPELGWVADGASWRLNAAVDLAPDPWAQSDPTRVHVRRGRSYDDGYLRGYENSHGLGTAYASKAELDAASISSWGYYYDAANDELYVRQANGSAPEYINYVDTGNAWDYTSRLADGYWEGLSDDAGQGWRSWDVTELLQRWLGTDGFAAEEDFGVQINNTVRYGYGGYFFLSEADGLYDPVNDKMEGQSGFDPAYAVELATLRPTLMIDMQANTGPSPMPVPEPATMVLLTIGGSFMALGFWRHRRRLALD